eukprot:2190722-Rhodomonas_salina.1
MANPNEDDLLAARLYGATSTSTTRERSATVPYKKEKRRLQTSKQAEDSEGSVARRTRSVTHTASDTQCNLKPEVIMYRDRLRTDAEEAVGTLALRRRAEADEECKPEGGAERRRRKRGEGGAQRRRRSVREGEGLRGGGVQGRSSAEEEWNAHL